MICDTVLEQRILETFFNLENFDGHKLILSPFTDRKKQKAWDKTREKYMPVKRRQIETDRGSYYSEEDG